MEGGAVCTRESTVITGRPGPNLAIRMLHRPAFALLVLSLVMGLAGRGQAPAPTKGQALMKEGRFQEALPALESEAAAAPDDPGPALGRAGCLIQLGRWNEALAASEEILGRFPKNAQAVILRGDCLLLTFQQGRAVDAYRSALPDPRWGSVGAAKAASAALAWGQKKLALSILQEAKARGVPLTAAALDTEYRATEDIREKVSALKELIARNPDDSGLKDQLALDEALAARSPSGNAAPKVYPAQTPIKEIYREPSISVTLLDDPKPVWLGLDTGGESLLLNDDLAKRLAFPALGQSVYGGWGYRGLQQTRTVYVEKLEVAGRVITGAPATVNTRDAEFWTKKGGYIGLGPFQGDVVLYDRRGGVFALWPPGTDPAGLLGKGAVSLPAIEHRGLCLIPVSLNGGEPHPFLLDTGAPYTLLDKELCARIGIRMNSGKYGNVHGLGFSGAFTSNVAESVVVGFAGRSFIRRYILVTEIPQRFPVPLYGILGRDLLIDFKLVIDGPGARVAFKPY
jgi:tetratricopeptide (TPR) repeat protein